VNNVKKLGTVRTTISIPTDLKRRMDEQAKSVNWSQVACHAFEGMLASIASRKEKLEMSDVIQRLRASTHASNDQEFNSGFSAGQQWAEREAAASDLKRLDGFHFQARHDWSTFFDSNAGSSAYTTAERLYTVFNPDADPRDAGEFWCPIVGEGKEHESDQWVRGFAEGALNVWWKVKDQL
jgi:hypothetical protein